MNNAMRKRIAALKLDEIKDELEDLLADEEGADGNRGHRKVRQALREASEAVSEVHYLATTPRSEWD